MHPIFGSSHKIGIHIFILSMLSCSIVSALSSHTYEQIRLVANDASFNADFIDSRLINPWGLTFGPEGNLIVADNDSTVLATSYRQNGSILPFTIQGSFNPTGLESNHREHDFLIGTSPNKRPAQLLFATEGGMILAYSNQVDENNAIVVVDRSPFGSVYKGLALATVPFSSHQSIFAADFFNAKIDVFDSNFNFVRSFTDPSIPAGFAPFNVQNIHGLLYVTYAKQLPPLNHDDDPGPGNGFVDIFNPDGTFVRRLVSNGALNSPWGLALAPKNFGRLSGALLVGNFGDGIINAYNPQDGTFLGNITDDNYDPIVIDGLWSIKFGRREEHTLNEGECCAKLYFTSGPNGEADGLIGYIIPE